MRQDNVWSAFPDPGLECVFCGMFVDDAVFVEEESSGARDVSCLGCVAKQRGEGLTIKILREATVEDST